MKRWWISHGWDSLATWPQRPAGQATAVPQRSVATAEHRQHSDLQNKYRSQNIAGYAATSVEQTKMNYGSLPDIYRSLYEDGTSACDGTFWSCQEDLESNSGFPLLRSMGENKAHIDNTETVWWSTEGRNVIHRLWNNYLTAYWERTQQWKNQLCNNLVYTSFMQANGKTDFLTALWYC